MFLALLDRNSGRGWARAKNSRDVMRAHAPPRQGQREGPGGASEPQRSGAVHAPLTLETGGHAAKQRETCHVCVRGVTWQLAYASIPAHPWRCLEAATPQGPPAYGCPEAGV